MTRALLTEKHGPRRAVTLRFFKTIYLVGEVVEGEEKRGNSMKPRTGMRG
jgi:hypothetical protein|tara:strand:+ start:94 stop:243 length:150 start_codon:yes stop_codon:yes gene_type:complete